MPMNYCILQCMIEFSLCVVRQEELLSATFYCKIKGAGYSFEEYVKA